MQECVEAMGEREIPERGCDDESVCLHFHWTFIILLGGVC